ncbi:transposase [Xylophilus sp. ASV27]|uniref:transposase n=1 Tax=Xylophilus sp. ASV27 TaxID=2795129 RepID=UPI0018EE290D|nr:transposase [Xylophilus sp. ASV27]
MLVSTRTLGGHVDRIEQQPSPGRRRRGLHSEEFKADAVAAASQAGMSMASVALARGINANLLRRWVREAELPQAVVRGKPAAGASTFVPVRVPAPIAQPTEIRIDVRRGARTITVSWPMAAAAECAYWMRELLR